jgi:hypothetical protein
MGASKVLQVIFPVFENDTATGIGASDAVAVTAVANVTDSITLNVLLSVHLGIGGRPGTSQPGFEITKRLVMLAIEMLLKTATVYQTCRTIGKKATNLVTNIARTYPSSINVLWFVNFGRLSGEVNGATDRQRPQPAAWSVDRFV